MTPTLEHLRAITGRSYTEGTTPHRNVSSLLGLLQQGAASNRNRLAEPNQLAQFFGQVLHESNAFMYNAELWGPTDAQRRYEPPSELASRLGNVSRGDGFKYRGRDFIQLTGRSNYKQFYAWVATAVDEVCPDFENDPDALLVEPWLGLASIWYWGSHGCVPAADTGSIAAVTHCVNGGSNGLADRENWFTKTALVFLGYKPTALKLFQQDTGLTADGIAGPNTWAKMTSLLKAMPWSEAATQTVSWEDEGNALVAAFTDWFSRRLKG